MQRSETTVSKIARAAMWVCFAAFVMGAAISFVEGVLPGMIIKAASGETEFTELPESINLMLFGLIGFAIASVFCQDRFWLFWRGRERRR